MTMRIGTQGVRVPGVPARSWRWKTASPRCCSGCAAGGCPRPGPATVPVHVLCDQGLGSRDLWAQIVALGYPLGGHPCLRYQPKVTLQPEGQTARVPVRSLITGPGDLWVGTGRAFRDQPLESTLIVLHACGQKQPWVLLTNTPVAQTEPTLYVCRNWIEQGFRGLKTVGDPGGT